MDIQYRRLTLLKALLLAIFMIASITFCFKILTPSLAQNDEEREIEDKIPKHLPLKVKLKEEKEAKIKDFKNDAWLLDFELEVTNTKAVSFTQGDPCQDKNLDAKAPRTLVRHHQHLASIQPKGFPVKSNHKSILASARTIDFGNCDRVGGVASQKSKDGSGQQKSGDDTQTAKKWKTRQREQNEKICRSVHLDNADRGFVNLHCLIS